jgi:translation initiation factor 2 subunit 2
MDYDEQLSRAMERSPDVTEAADRMELPTAEARTEGSVTVLENLPAIADRMGRDPTHVMRYVQSTLGTSASLDERERLRLTGSFGADRLDEVLSAYAEAYVRCPECGLPDTELEREHGAEVRQCSACGARSPTGD